MPQRPTRSTSPSATGPKRHARWGVTALTLAAAFALVACSSAPAATTAPSAPPASEAPSSPSAAPESSAPEASPSAAPSASAAAAQDLAITGTDFAFEAPASIPAGPTKITLTNAGQEEHQAQIAGLVEGKTFEDLTAALQSGDENAALALVTLSGGPTGVAPGDAVSTTSDLKPGQYVFLCFVPSADGVPHFAKGMIAPIEVTEPASTAALPSGDAELVLKDFAFVGVDTLSAGQHTVTVKNDGPQAHEATIVKLADGVDVSALIPMFTSPSTEPPPAGPPPFTSVGGVAGIAPGATVTMDVDLEPGNYAYLCFVPDTATGTPHVALGMVGALTVE